MSEQIVFFKKSKIDLSNESVEITVTDAVATNTGQSFVDFLRNRSNDSGWATTGSTDAANTTLVFDMVDEQDITDVLLVFHNLKAYTLKYWNGSAWTDFSTPVNVSANTETTTHHEFTLVTTTKLQLIITGTMVVDDDKFVRQVIFTEKIGAGQLEGWPQIKNPRFNTEKKVNRMLSGKVSVIESRGSFNADLSVNHWKVSADLAIVENIYTRREGVLMWICGGEESQFFRALQGYRKKDLYLVRPTNDYEPEFYGGVYTNGIIMNMRLEESVD